MQTILKVVCNGKAQASIVEDYLAQFCVKAASETPSVEFPSPDADDVVFAKDDADEFRNEPNGQQRLRLGSFEKSPNQADSKTQLIFVNPIILSFQPNGQNLRLWVASPSPGPAGNTETE